MCRTAVPTQAAQPAVLNTAILMLFFPAVLLFCAIVTLTIKYPDPTRSAVIAPDSPPDIEST
jgi:hypothetical protein